MTPKEIHAVLRAFTDHCLVDVPATFIDGEGRVSYSDLEDHVHGLSDSSLEEVSKIVENYL